MSIEFIILKVQVQVASVEAKLPIVGPGIYLTIVNTDFCSFSPAIDDAEDIQDEFGWPDGVTFQFNF